MVASVRLLVPVVAHAPADNPDPVVAHAQAAVGDNKIARLAPVAAAVAHSAKVVSAAVARAVRNAKVADVVQPRQ
ncbi:hypothetical protein GCM10007338_02940 [Corynebacterium pelargi]|nr:hypothetical protein GCM10007338_02940 [Corynebacterium pelargi]